MWIEHIKNTNFLMQLFKDVPELSNVEIEKFDIDYYGREIKIILKIPRLIDEIPIKWRNKNFNAALIEMDFWDITHLVMSMDSNKKSNISIIKKSDKLAVEIQGGINVSFLTVGGYIQHVGGYIM